MVDLFPASREEKIAELKRELDMRRDAYPRWIAAGRMRQEQADKRVRVLEAVLADYEAAP